MSHNSIRYKGSFSQVFGRTTTLHTDICTQTERQTERRTRQTDRQAVHEETSYMLFDYRINRLLITLVFHSIKITLSRVSNCKCLGVTTDDRLSWKEHIHHVMDTVNRFLLKIRNRLNRKVFKDLLCALIDAHVMQGVEINQSFNQYSFN